MPHAGGRGADAGEEKLMIAMDMRGGGIKGNNPSSITELPHQ
jgi:hypothetical protein